MERLGRVKMCIEIKKSGKRSRTDNIYVDITVEGVIGDKVWKCGWNFTMITKNHSIVAPFDFRKGKPERIPIPDEIEKYN